MRKKNHEKQKSKTINHVVIKINITIRSTFECTMNPIEMKTMILKQMNILNTGYLSDGHIGVESFPRRLFA